MPSIAEPPTSSASTLAGHRATLVQTPTASPIVAAVPRGVVTTRCRGWGLAHSRCEARWLLYEPRHLLDRAWRDSLPRATSGDTEYRWSCLSDPLGSIRRTFLRARFALRRARDRRICMRAGVWPRATAARARLSVQHRPIPPGSPARRSEPRRGHRSSRRPACAACHRRCHSRATPHRHFVAEADEPGVVLVVRRVSLAGNIGGKIGNRPCRSARQNALHHALELINR